MVGSLTGDSYQRGGVVNQPKQVDEDKEHYAAQIHLATVVFDVCIQETESFEQEGIGTDLAYLLGAICKNNMVEWRKPTLPALYFVLNKVFKKEHPVWSHIVIWEEE